MTAGVSSISMLRSRALLVCHVALFLYIASVTNRGTPCLGWFKPAIQIYEIYLSDNIYVYVNYFSIIYAKSMLNK